jgi:hypothetical protein
MTDDRERNNDLLFTKPLLECAYETVEIRQAVGFLGGRNGDVYLFGQRPAVLRSGQKRRIDKLQTIIVAELTAETSRLIGHLNDNIGILDGCPAGWNKALIDFRLSENTEAFAVDAPGDDAHGAIAAGTLTAAGGVDFHTGTPRRVQQRCICLYVDYDP